MARFLHTMVTCFALLTVGTAVAVPPRVSLAALVFVGGQRVSPQSAISILPLTLQYLRQKFGHVFTFTHHILPGDGTKGNEHLSEVDAEDIIARFYYENQHDTIALLSPCKSPDPLSNVMISLQISS